MAATAIFVFIFTSCFKNFGVSHEDEHTLKVSWRSVHLFKSYCTVCFGWFIMGFPYYPKMGFWVPYIFPIEDCLRRRSRRMSHQWWKSALFTGSYRVWRISSEKTGKSREKRIFHPTGQTPPVNRFRPKYYWVSYPRGNQIWKILSWSVHPFTLQEVMKFNPSPLKATWPITHCIALPCMHVIN